MAFDQTTRHRLQCFVADARLLLVHEFTRQLQSIYGMNPVTGDIADIKTLVGLTPNQQESAQLLRDTFAHYFVSSDKGKEKARRLTALDRIVREQAFTVLNRLAALRVSEARGFLTESLANGYESKGFQLFHRIAGTSLGETGDAYRHYLFSIFDEFTLDLSVLFDRFSAQGRLFPSPPVLIELLNLINDDEVTFLWTEDETIGWIFQYWNGRDEIDKMRKASRIPRNSREMAVRNQFFTPRYIVEFLTDNTLARLWYEMTKGKTKLIDECEYLIRRENEIFLTQGEKAPEVETFEDLSQEELLKKPVYTEYRVLKDPREIRMLDPACGSMHFGLYCFDLFERIYEEAWDIEIGQGTDSFIREGNIQALTETYLDKTEFLRHVPRLIIENNIHGVDIDPRAAQVAGLTLWQRAHNSWQKAGIKPQYRPQTLKSNIVCAEPMPGEKELLQEFASQLKPTLLGQLVEVIFEKMQLAGEAGTLLKIEIEIEEAIAGAKEIWLQQNQAISQFPDLAKVAKKQGSIEFDVSDIDDEGFWLQAEQKILEALAIYASFASSKEIEQKRLFVADIVKGFSFIDLSKKKFDVILMNPPFGESSQATKQYIDSNYPSSKTNLLACFMERGHEKGHCNAKIGAIVSRTGFYLSTLSNFRKDILLDKSFLDCHLDLGSKVLDATVEVACSVYTKSRSKNNNSIPFLRLLTESDKKDQLLKEISCLCSGVRAQKTFLINQKQLSVLTGSPFVYWISNDIAEKLSDFECLEPNNASIRVGLQTGTDFRFLRLWWEVPSNGIVTCPDDINKDVTRNEYLKASDKPNAWCYFSKIDQASPFIASIHLLVNWGGNGREIKAYHIQNGDSPSRYVRSEQSYFLPSISYMLRSTRIVPYAVPRGVIPTAGRSQIYPANANSNDLLMIVSSNIATAVARFRGENFEGPKFQNSMVSAIPFGNLSLIDKTSIMKSIQKKSLNFSSRYQADETAIQFSGKIDLEEKVESKLDRSSLLGKENEKLIAKAYRLGDEELAALEIDMMECINIPKWLKNGSEGTSEELCNTNYREGKIISWAFGVAIGRFDISKMINNEAPIDIEDPFAPLPSISPGMIRHNSCIFSDSKGIFSSDEDNVENIQSTILNVLNIAKIATSNDITNWLSKDFFKYHLKQYTKSRRQAPIYWPFQTLSSSFTIWVYFHKLNNQTLLTCINDYIDPKLAQIITDLTTLKSEISRSSSDEKLIDRLTDFSSELENMRDEFLRLNKFWQPNLNDGVQITAAPIWRLFQHKPWQKKLKQTWGKLEDGDYDWAHLAFSTWPKRVLKKCHADRSLAIAHDVENDLWHEVEVIKAHKKEPVWEWQPKSLSGSELHSYIKDKISTDDRLKLYRSNNTNENGGS